MKRMFTAILMASLVSIGLAGCAEKTASSKQETTVATPGGTTKITTETEVTKTGKNPPSVTR